MMKKRKIKACFLCLLSVVAVLAGCGKEKGAATREYRIFYLDASGVQLVGEPCDIEGGSVEKRVESILSLMQEKPDTIDYESVFSDGVKVTGWELSGTKLDIHFSPEYEELTTAKEVLFRAAVVQSLTQVSGVDYVRFYVGDEPLKDGEGREYGYMSEEDFVQNTGYSLHNYQTANLTLYYSNKKGDMLAEESVSVRYNSNMSVEKLIVEQLLKGSSGPDKKSALPADTKILGVSVKDDTCYVNLDEGFLSMAEQVNPKVTVYSLVNSIIQGGSAKQVQILVNGETDVMYRETVDLGKPLTEDMSLVEEKD